jgi:hypothetical protein
MRLRSPLKTTYHGKYRCAGSKFAGTRVLGDQIRILADGASRGDTCCSQRRAHDVVA